MHFGFTALFGLLNFERFALLQKNVQKNPISKKWWKISLAVGVESPTNLNGCVTVTCIFIPAKAFARIMESPAYVCLFVRLSVCLLPR